ncbi:hypothetical protein Ahy_B03g067422 [Arachis hypogaea]|uniref:Major facilitator superfamily (MFS) profile domain-containing protein n=1 Tax=Arachis hypogaea TaxID=3818 RepID=A0A445A6R3_ARAHY|nr:hypothetical protein Ahy_B03g067422 [Arachis hypogaea]
MIGAFGFLYLTQSLDKTKADAGYSPGIGIKNSLLILGVVNTLGFLFTFLVPEPNGKSLEEISGEHELGNEKESLWHDSAAYGDLLCRLRPLLPPRTNVGYDDALLFPVLARIRYGRQTRKLAAQSWPEEYLQSLSHRYSRRNSMLHQMRLIIR